MIITKNYNLTEKDDNSNIVILSCAKYSITLLSVLLITFSKVVP
jgi:hypothetical protein